MMGFGFDFGLGFGLFQIFFTLMFLLVFGLILFSILSNLKQWNKNNHSPRITVPARVVSKRTSVSHYHHTDHVGHTSTSTSYYVTFEVESGDRMELHMAGQQYGLLVEGDRGQLTFQGTRYLDFRRI